MGSNPWRVGVFKICSAREEAHRKGYRHLHFVNHAVHAWHETRKRWVGDQSQRSKRITKGPIISWTTTYEELLSTIEPFSEAIPLAEMVDFLVDIWHEKGLFD